MLTNLKYTLYHFGCVQLNRNTEDPQIKANVFHFINNNNLSNCIISI